jgi:hypothetical protein
VSLIPGAGALDHRWQAALVCLSVSPAEPGPSVERGLHEPSVRILKLIAEALNISTETLLAQAGLLDADHSESADSIAVETAIRADAHLTDEQKSALIAVYRSMLQT